MNSKHVPTVGIVILNWNGLSLTQACLASLRAQTYRNYAVIIVDNGSTDDSIVWLSEQPDIVLIRNNTNTGFAHAINQGFNASIERGCTYIIALNNDTEIDKHWLKNIIAFMDTHPKIDFAQGATMQLVDKHLYDSSGIYLERGFIPRQRALGLDNPQLNIPVIGPNAAGAVYRANMLRSIRQRSGDFFDSRFFAYVEDVDFDLRCTMRGHSFALVPEAKLYHKGSATGNRVAKKKMFWGARNMVFLVYKNTPGAVLRKNIKLIIKSHLANLQFLWCEQRQNFLPYAYGLAVGLLMLPRFYTDRRQNLRKQKISNTTLQALLVPSNPPLTNPLKKLRKLLQ